MGRTCDFSHKPRALPAMANQVSLFQVGPYAILVVGDSVTEWSD